MYHRLIRYKMSEYSFYIPAIGNASEHKIGNAFWLNNVGDVDRVDFFENSSGIWCAFVHVDNLYDNYLVSKILDEIESYGSHQFWFNEREYFILRKMTCTKIPTTSMNIHQIADKLTQHGAKIAENDAKIAELEARILEKDQVIDGYRRRQLDTFEYGRLAHRAMWARSPSDDSYDVNVEEIVNSLIGPRWPEEDDSVFPAVYSARSDDTMSVEM